MITKFKRNFSLFSLMGLSACRTYEGSVSDHFDGTHFYNPWSQQESGLLDVLRWKLGDKAKEWPEHVVNNPTPLIPPAYREGNVSITFVNHASFLIQVAGLNILTDPVWSERTSPFQWVGPKRVREPGIAFDALPKIDIVLVSHNHYDHLDLPTLHRLSDRDKPRVFVPLGDQNWLEKDSIANVQELDWWQTIVVSPEIKIHFAPSQHWSSRTNIDRNKSLWGSFLIEYQGKAIYIAGDTGYGPHFQWAAEHFPHIEVALLPIGAYEPRWFMKYAHMDPEDALKAFHDLKANRGMAMHFGCWQLTDEAIDDPARDLAALMKGQPKLEANFVVPEVGGTYRYQF